MRKLTTTILFSLVCIHFLSAQEWSERANDHYENDWSFGVGMNAVDDSGFMTKELFNIKENWNLGIPIYISAEYYRNNKFSFAANLSFNKYNEGKTVDHATVLKDHEASYIAFDLAAKYSFRDLLKTHAFDPYVFLGPGFTNIGEHKTDATNLLVPSKGRMTFNVGVGFNYWLSKNWGLNMNALGKYALVSDATNHKQYSLGVLYFISKRKGKEILDY